MQQSRNAPSSRHTSSSGQQSRLKSSALVQEAFKTFQPPVLSHHQTIVWAGMPAFFVLIAYTVYLTQASKDFCFDTRHANKKWWACTDYDESWILGLSFLTIEILLGIVCFFSKSTTSVAVFRFLQSAVFAVWGYQVLMEHRDVLKIKVEAYYLPSVLGGYSGVSVEDSLDYILHDTPYNPVTRNKFVYHFAVGGAYVVDLYNFFYEGRSSDSLYRFVQISLYFILWFSLNFAGLIALGCLFAFTNEVLSAFFSLTVVFAQLGWHKLARISVIQNMLLFVYIKLMVWPNYMFARPEIDFEANGKSELLKLFQVNSILMIMLVSIQLYWILSIVQAMAKPRKGHLHSD